ncbi:hypothetical protein CFP56_007360 [Quercus suber]|uniref:DC1 domain-containing protein n=1 Tax=Quercus suber TaxID=58331 RepID=A0AAW0L7H6_QUESU
MLGNYTREKEDEDDDWIKYFDHPHHWLSLAEVDNSEMDCPVCGKKLGLSFNYIFTYLCPYGVHVSCAKLPRVVKSPFHPEHPITLTRPRYGRQFVCMGCNLQFNGFSYCCNDCNFQLDLECVWLVKDKMQTLTHSHHEHQLELLKNVPKKRYNCAVCLEYCLDPLPTYGCLQCLLFLHISCFGESNCPLEIQHYYHPHPLTFSITSHRTLTPSPQTATTYLESTLPTTSSPPTFTCKAFHNSARKIHWCYSCKQCQDFGMDIACATISKTASQIQHFLHGHPLSLLYKYVNYQQVASCRVCMKSCTGHTYICHPFHPYHLLTLLDQSNSPGRCNACRNSPGRINYICEIDNCSFLLHVECNHNSHPLFLANSPVQEEVEDETEEFYCHACEEERDPQLPVYYCANCYFVLEINCVHSQIISSLKGEHGDVELRSTLGHFGKLICKNKAKEMVQKKEQIKTALTLYDNLKSWSRNEIEQLNSVLRVEETENRDEDSVFEAFLYYYKNYTEFKKVIDRVVEIPAPFMSVENVEIDSKWAPKEEVASVGDYMIIQRLAPILEHLLSKHGDISATSMLRPKVKMYLFNMLCDSIYSMINTKIVDVTVDLLLNWWTRLRILQFAEFKIQFAFDHLKRVVQACLLFQEDDTLNEIDRDILALQEKRKSIIAARSSLTEEHLREASILKNWKAGTLFLYNK